MAKISSWVVLAAAGLLFAFSLGALTSRSSTAQQIEPLAGSSLFPRQSDLWQFQLNPSLWQGSGYVMEVKVDARGRLPVITQCVLNVVVTSVGSHLTIYELGPSDSLLLFARLPTGLSDPGYQPVIFPGIKLNPGRYLIYSPYLGSDKQVVLTGYWAKP